MEITGKIIVALPETGGVSRTGNQWKKREYVLETQENFPRKVFFDFFGEKADQYPLSVGQTVKLSFDIESREYNGRWYTSIRGWKAEQVMEGNSAAPATSAAYQAAAQGAYQQAPAQNGFQAASAPAVDPFAASSGDTSEDLPF